MPSPLIRSMHPRDFVVDQTWLAFRMNRLPIVADADEFDVFVLQDAASLFIFGSAFAPHGAECPSEADVVDLFEQARSHRRQWPTELVLPGKPSPRNSLVAVAGKHGIPVRAVAESRMSFYILDVQSSFEEHALRGGRNGTRS